MVNFVFHLRWLLWILGGGVVAVLGLQKLKLIPTKKSEDLFRNYYFHILGAIVGGFFLLASIAKISQFRAMQLNAQDFWLFVDILEQLKQGGLFLTRFAPQSLGFVQHGAVHPMFTWAILLPFSWLLGSVGAALLFGPVVLSGAAYLLALLSRKQWGNRNSIYFAFAFLASTQVGRILMYDVHPEAAYPLLVFLWLWAMGMDGSGKVRKGFLWVATLLGMGVKEDSFLVLGPWIVWAIIFLKSSQRKAAVQSGILAFVVMAFQMLAVKMWASGQWGPTHWNGYPVTLSASPGLFKGLQWSSIDQVEKIISLWARESGGLLGMVQGAGTFLISRPWLSLIVLAPWVVMSWEFWWIVLPLAGAYSLLEGARNLWNYYSAPFLSTFWFWAQREKGDFSQKREVRKWKVAWVLCAAMLFGSAHLSFYFSTERSLEMRNEVRDLLPCLKGRGWVAPHLIAWVPLEKILTDRFPKAPIDWKDLDFVLISPEVERFELSRSELEKAQVFLKSNANWRRVGSDCKEIGEHKDMVQLFLRY